MKKRKRTYRFHDPNPAAMTADYLLKVFIEADAKKVDAAVREAAGVGWEAENNGEFVNRQRTP
jgi:hypothetical protein